MKRKKYFKLPPNIIIEKMTDNSLSHDRRGAVAGTKQIYRLFGPPRDMMFMGVMTADTYFEMINAYIFGLYIFTIFAAHALIESSLSVGFMFSSEDEAIAEGGLSNAKLRNATGWGPRFASVRQGWPVMLEEMKDLPRH